MTHDALERFAVVVHEVRSPVAALAAIAHAFPAADRDERRSLVRLGVAGVRAIERLVVDAAAVSIEPERVDVARLAHDAAATARLGGASVRVVGQTHVVVQADPVRLRQALDNLLANAARHAPGSDVIVEVGHAGGVATLSVSDGGPGIPIDDRARIFEPGVRLGGGDGSGLGLPLARAIADAHGGKLTVGPRPREGVTFTLTLPAAVGA